MIDRFSGELQGPLTKTCQLKNTVHLERSMHHATYSKLNHRRTTTVSTINLIYNCCTCMASSIPCLLGRLRRDGRASACGSTHVRNCHERSNIGKLRLHMKSAVLPRSVALQQYSVRDFVFDSNDGKHQQQATTATAAAKQTKINADLFCVLHGLAAAG